MHIYKDAIQLIHRVGSAQHHLKERILVRSINIYILVHNVQHKTAFVLTFFCTRLSG